MKPPLLFLCHRIPYPPNKGDKIRSYHLLKYLSDSYSIYLGGFIDDAEDWKHLSTLNEICEETFFVQLNPTKGRIRSLVGFITGKPLTLPYYYSGALDNWVRKTAAKHSIGKLIAFSSAMAQYARYPRQPFTRRLIDFVDIDSDKWGQYAKSKRLPLSWIYKREADLLLRYEKEVAGEFGFSFFVSETEAEMFKKLAPSVAPNVDYFNNGVDTEYFDPGKVDDNPYPDTVKPIVFTGAMDYWPNIDAVTWFSEKVLPELIRHEPMIRFYIVGSKPSETVMKLGDKPQITVTGRVEDIRPYLKYAAACVAPMRIARGIQNKVLEAMAMERPVITSPQGYEGITADTENELSVATEEDEWIKNVYRILSIDTNIMGRAARARVVKDYSWQGSLARLGQHL